MPMASGAPKLKPLPSLGAGTSPSTRVKSPSPVVRPLVALGTGAFPPTLVTIDEATQSAVVRLLKPLTPGVTYRAFRADLQDSAIGEASPFLEFTVAGEFYLGPDPRTVPLTLATCSRRTAAGVCEVDMETRVGTTLTNTLDVLTSQACEASSTGVPRLLDPDGVEIAISTWTLGDGVHVTPTPSLRENAIYTLELPALRDLYWGNALAEKDRVVHFPHARGSFAAARLDAACRRRHGSPARGSHPARVQCPIGLPLAALSDIARCCLGDGTNGFPLADPRRPEHREGAAPAAHRGDHLSAAGWGGRQGRGGRYPVYPA